MSAKMTRRDFVRSTVSAGVGLWILSNSAFARSYIANEKLNIAIIGAGGRGKGNLDAVKSENIVAICDVDEERAAAAFKEFPKAKKYHDFRKMLDEMSNQIDAVIVSTPDHVHAVASVWAMKLSKHVYCEKPLCYCIHEARIMREVAVQYRVATQMGNQGTASNGFRTNVEIIQSGAIGYVREVHVWTNRPIWPQGMDRPTETPPIPKHLDWDLWVGPAPWRPYHPAYLPFKWRGWIDFGTGALGDMGCHTMNLPVMALKLDLAIQMGLPIIVEAKSSGMNYESYPKWSIIRYEFPARGELPPVKLIWYDGGKKPPKDLLMGEKMTDSGCLIIGEKGTLFSPGDGGSARILLPKEKFAGYQPPKPTLPRSPGHHKEWLIACKGGPPAMSNFNYAALLAEIVLLGNLALLVGERMVWDPQNIHVKWNIKADQYIYRHYRKGWEL